MDSGALGREYAGGDLLIRQGETGDCMFVVLEGTAEVFTEKDGRETLLNTVGPGEIFGEMAIFERGARSASVRAKGPVRVMTLDRKQFLKRVQQDPTAAFSLLETMSRRIRRLSRRVAELEGAR